MTPTDEAREVALELCRDIVGCNECIRCEAFRDDCDDRNAIAKAIEAYADQRVQAEREAWEGMIAELAEASGQQAETLKSEGLPKLAAVTTVYALSLRAMIEKGPKRAETAGGG